MFWRPPDNLAMTPKLTLPFNPHRENILEGEVKPTFTPSRRTNLEPLRHSGFSLRWCRSRRRPSARPTSRTASLVDGESKYPRLPQ